MTTATAARAHLSGPKPSNLGFREAKEGIAWKGNQCTRLNTLEHNSELVELNAEQNGSFEYLDLASHLRHLKSSKQQ